MSFKIELTRQEINDIQNGLISYIAKINRLKKPGSVAANNMEKRYKRLYKFFDVLKKGEG